MPFLKHCTLLLGLVARDAFAIDMDLGRIAQIEEENFCSSKISQIQAGQFQNLTDQRGKLLLETCDDAFVRFTESQDIAGCLRAVAFTAFEAMAMEGYYTSAQRCYRRAMATADAPHFRSPSFYGIWSNIVHLFGTDAVEEVMHMAVGVS